MTENHPLGVTRGVFPDQFDGRLPSGSGQYLDVLPEKKGI